LFTLKEFLKEEVKPALGCTEPAAVALAVARAHQEIDNKEELKCLQINVSSNVYKNGMDVGIPGTNGARGNAVAAALAYICGSAAYGLEVLRGCGTKELKKAELMLKDNKVDLKCSPDKSGVYVQAVISTKNQKAECVIEHDHSRITLVKKNNKIVFKEQELKSNGSSSPVVEQIGDLSFKQVISLVDQLDAEDVLYLNQGIKMNLEIADYGLEDGSVSGASFGKNLKKILEERGIEPDLGYLIKIYNYAAADARMAGAVMPVMSSAGSGNHGITAILPIAITAEYENKSEVELAEAVAISHLTTSYVKSKIGRLSPVCGCAVAAGAGSAAGLTYLLGGNLAQAKLAIKTLLANISGMICDGAKASCALKVGTAAFESYLAALFALNNQGISSEQGIIGDSIEKTVNNVGMINGMGMKDMDSIIIDIMENRSKNDGQEGKRQAQRLDWGKI
jgi:L-cysteine desulfidase